MTNIYIELAKANLEKAPQFYGHLVEMGIRQKYTVSQELAILRQRDAKPEEFAEYNAYCEICKTEAKKALGIEVK